MSMIIRSDIKKKIILLLMGSVALGLTTSPRAQRRIFRALKRDWKFIGKQKLYRNVKELEKQKMIHYRNKGEWWNIELTKKGKKHAKKLGFNKLKIAKPKRWDGKWRMIIFDIPENKKIVREALRKKIQELGFQELQKSVFIYPYPCNKEIEIVVKFFKAEKFVKQFIAVGLDNNTEKIFKNKFELA